MLKKLAALWSSPHRFAHLRNLLEIRANKVLANAKVAGDSVITFDAFCAEADAIAAGLRHQLQPSGEAERSVREVRAQFETAAAGRDDLPFPASFNADVSFAKLAYGLTRSLASQEIVEAGVGYGVTSALLLRAAGENGHGRLTSVDLPSLGDPNSVCIGLAVPEHLRRRWTLHTGSNRSWLPRILSERPQVDFFVSDSANVYTIQRFEFEQVWPFLPTRGVMLFNNVGAPFVAFLRTNPEVKVSLVRQVENAPNVTAIIQRR